MLHRNMLRDPSEYALSPVQWIGRLRLTSLAYNTWIFANASTIPVILDVAWTEFTLPSPEAPFGPKFTKHFIPDEHRFQSNPKRKRLVSIYDTWSLRCILINHLYAGIFVWDNRDDRTGRNFEAITRIPARVARGSASDRAIRS